MRRKRLIRPTNGSKHKNMRGLVGVIRRASVASGTVHIMADAAKTTYPHELKLLVRSQRLDHPAIELLLVGLDPTINVSLNIAF